MKRDQDNARLRDQREQVKAELLELKARDSASLHSNAEAKALSQSRAVCAKGVCLPKLNEEFQDRIRMLQSEILRYKTFLAAKSGDEDFLRFLLREEDISYIDDLKVRLRLVFYQVHRK